jgi:hypothetical protein
MSALHSLITSSLLIAVLAAGSGGTAATPDTPPPEADLTIVAESFDTQTITLTAGEATTLFFRNLDGQPYNRVTRGADVDSARKLLE